MSDALQAKLLRVMEYGLVRPVGTTTQYEVDVRVIAATHRDLSQLVTRKIGDHVGFAVSLATTDLGVALAGRGRGTILVLQPPIAGTHLAGESEAIGEMLQKGGGLLALVEHDDRFGHGTRMNSS